MGTKCVTKPFPIRPSTTIDAPPCNGAFLMILPPSASHVVYLIENNETCALISCRWWLSCTRLFFPPPFVWRGWVNVLITFPPHTPFTEQARKRSNIYIIYTLTSPSSLTLSTSCSFRDLLAHPSPCTHSLTHLSIDPIPHRGTGQAREAPSKKHRCRCGCREGQG